MMSTNSSGTKLTPASVWLILSNQTVIVFQTGEVAADIVNTQLVLDLRAGFHPAGNACQDGEIDDVLGAELFYQDILSLINERRVFFRQGSKHLPPTCLPTVK